MPRKVVPVAAPHRPPPGRDVPSEPVLPGWVLALGMSAVLLISVIIVFAGWLCVALASREAFTAGSARGAVVIDEIGNREIVTAPVAIRSEEKIAEVDTAPHAQPVVRPSAEPEAPQAFEIPRRLPMRTERQTTKLHTPIEPVEIPKLPGRIDYSIRRLALPEAPRPLRLAISPVGHDDVAKV